MTLPKADILWMGVAQRGWCWIADHRLHMLEVRPFGRRFLWTVEHNDACRDEGGVIMGLGTSPEHAQDKAMSACNELPCAPQPIAGIPYRMAREIADLLDG